MNNQITDGPTDEANRGGQWPGPVYSPLSVYDPMAENLALQAHIAKQDEKIDKLSADYKFANELWVSTSKDREGIKAERDKLAQDNARLREALHNIVRLGGSSVIERRHFGSIDIAAKALAATGSPAPAQTFPDIGNDPLKVRDKDHLKASRERLDNARGLQQKEAPDQTALVWRVDLSRISDALTLAEARLEHLGFKEITRAEYDRQQSEQTKEQAVIKILSEALQTIKRWQEEDESGSSIARYVGDALARADAAGKGEM